MKTVGASSVALAGCLGGGGGGDGDGSPADQDAGATTTTAGSTEPIVVAATTALSGRLSQLGKDIHTGYQIGVERINDEGGIDGRELELVIKDDQSDPKTVRTQLQQIVSNNDVDMIWGSFSSLLVTAGSAFAESQELPFLGVTFAFEAPHRKKNFEWTFAPFTKSRDIAASTLELVKTIPSGERPGAVGIWEPNTGWGAEMAERWESVFSDAGYDVVLREQYQLGSSDFSTLISKSKSAGVELLMGNPIPPGGITAMKQMKTNNFAPELIMFIRAPDSYGWWDALGEDGEYVVDAGPAWVPGLDTPGSETVIERYRAQDGVSSDAIPGVVVGDAYGLTQTAEQALAAADSTEPEAIREVLRSATFETTMGTFAFDEYGMPKKGQIIAPVGQWWNGKLRLVYPESDAENYMPLEYPMKPWGER
ncbi:MAG: amino acid ABC transporter substrate-binding protein [Halobacteriales archaeon]